MKKLSACWPDHPGRGAKSLWQVDFTAFSRVGEGETSRKRRRRVVTWSPSARGGQAGAKIGEASLRLR